MNKIINKNKIILLITATTIAGFSVFYATAGIFKTNTQVVNDLTNGLVGYWTFDGQDTNWATGVVSDKSGNNNTGIITNMSTSTSPRSGAVGQALNFNGSTGYVDVTNITSAIDPPFSFGVWIKLNSIPSANKRIISKSGSFAMYATPTGVICEDTNTSRGPNMALTWVAGQWYHVACVISASDVTGAGQSIYVNGSNNGSFSDGWAPSDSGISLKIGANGGGGGLFFDGQIDEVRYYNRAIAPSEITELYNQGAKRLTKINTNQKTDIVPSGLTGYWTFDGPDTNWATGVMSDVSGGGNNGQMTGMSTSTNPTNGPVSQAFKFDGVNDYIEMPGSFMNWEYTQPFTVSFWAYSDWSLWDGVSTLNQSDLFGKHDNSLNRGIRIIYDQDNGRVGLRLSVNNTYSFQANSNLVSGDKWQHWVFAYDGSGLGTGVAIYLDGVYKGTGTAGNLLSSPSPTILNSVTAKIGMDVFTGYTNARTDEFRVYNRVLSQTEVTALYNQGTNHLLKVNMPQTDLIPGSLVGYWTFNGQDTNWGANTTNDLSGNSNTGTIINMSTSTSPVAGISGQALKFDGSNDYIIKTGATGLPTGNNPFSISAWINRYSSIGAAGRSILFWGGGGNQFQLSSNKLRHWFDGSVLTANTALNINTWYHAAVTYDGTNRIIYLNGSVDSNSSTPPAQAVAGTDLYMGYEIYNENYFPGKVDELRVYSRALSANEVMELYRAGAGAN